jgi:ubiquinone/menaquinone biosynthesis C-methylase UbiE
MVLLIWLVAAPLGQLSAQDSIAEKAQQEVANERVAETSPDVAETSPDIKPKEKARRVYLGRIVAQYMSHLGASWLVRPEREREESVKESFEQLSLTEGMTVCDLGCGNGFWTLPIARAVGGTGKVLAVDIQPEMLVQLRQRASMENVNNIEPIRGEIDDPHLPVGAVDLVLLVDVYHEFSHPQSMLWAMRRSLKPNGVVALLEYREEDPEVPIKPLHKMSKTQIIKEYEANGLKLVREYNNLPWQHLMFFARNDSPLEKIEPVPFTKPKPQ